MNMIQLLHVQHRMILQGLYYLEKMNKAPEVSYDANGVKEVLYSLADSVDKHSQLEEKYLFPEWARQTKLKVDYLKIMTFEHGQVLGLLPSLEAEKNQKCVRKEVESFISFLRKHFFDEETIYFPYIEKKVGRKALERLAVQCGISSPTFLKTKHNP